MNYDYRPIRQNYTAHALVVLLFLFSGASFMCAAFFPLLGIAWQVLGLALLLPAIQLIARYMASRYLYRLHSYEDGSVDLEIFLYRGGDKMQLVSCVGLDEITAAVPLSASNAHVKKGIKRYNYAQDLRPVKALVLSISNADGDCEVLFCPDEHMIRAMETALAARQAKAPEV